MAIRIYEVESKDISKVKNILDAQDAKDPKTGQWVQNPFKSQGYIMRDASALGLSKPATYIHIRAEDSFFKANEKKLTDAGAKLLKGKEAADVQKKIDDLENAAMEGIGSIFG